MFRGGFLKYPKLSLGNELNVTALCSLFYYECNKNHPPFPESHDFWEMWYLDRGSAYMLLDDSRISLSQGEFFLIPPGATHGLCGDNVNNFNIFIISFVCDSPLLYDISSRIIPFTSKMKEQFSEIVDETHNAFLIPILDKGTLEITERKSGPFGSTQMVKNLTEVFLINLIRQQKGLYNKDKILGDSKLKTDISTSKKKILKDIDEYLLEHICEKISITDICNTFNYSKTHISTIFKQEKGTTIIEHFTQMKIAKAKDLIRENELSLSQIATTLGFSSPGYFSKTFKKVVGLTPDEYKTSLRNYLYYNLK